MPATLTLPSLSFRPMPALLVRDAASLLPRSRRYKVSALLLGRGLAPGRHAVPVVVAERARRVLGEGVAIPLAVRGPHEGGHDVEAPFGDLAGLAPEIGQAQVDVELEQVDPGRGLGHVQKRRNWVGRHMGALKFGPARIPSRESPEEAVSLLLEQGFTACEIDFEGRFWMDYPFAEQLGTAAADAGIVLSVHAP